MNGFSRANTWGLMAAALMAALAIVHADESTGATTSTMQAMQQQASSAMDKVKGMLQMEPLVEIGDSQLGGRQVNVHVPGVYDLKLDTRGSHGGVRIKQSVMSGLVNIFIDRTRDPATGHNSGPISVRVGGLTMYQNGEARNLASSGQV